MFAAIRIYRSSIVLLAVFHLAVFHESEDTENVIPGGDNKSTEAIIFITVSSIASTSPLTFKVTERQIELNWFNVEDEHVNDTNVWIGLFLEDPMEQGATSAVANTIILGSEGYFKTNVSFPYLTFDVKNLTDTCLGFWIALIKDTRVLLSNCYSARPNWMYEMRDVIGEKTLLDLMLPGTHNAGSFMRYDPQNDNVVTKYQMCQDEDIENQLIYGIRFLDLRPAYRDIGKDYEKFWISHGIFRINVTIKYVLQTVRNFLDSTNEIVIIDFHEFHLGIFSSTHEDRHRKLMELIVQELGHYALPRDHGYRRTLNELWKMNKRLLIGYADQRGHENLMFFPGVRHLWGDKDNLQDLRKYFEATVCYQSRMVLWSAMAELTPQILRLGSYGGLRKMAQDVNLNVTRWFREEWWQCANIVSTDYFLGNDIINVAIQTNKRRSER